MHCCRVTLGYNGDVANLLPTSERAHVHAEQYKRLGVFIVLGLLVTGVLGVLLTLPPLFVIQGRKRALEGQLDAVTKLIELKEGSAAGIALSDTKARLEFLNAALTVPSAHSLLYTITNSAPQGVALTHYTFMRGEEAVSATLTGQASSREALLAFGDALRQTGLFMSVDIPVGSLARSTNVPFNLTLTLQHTAQSAGAQQ